MFGREITFFYSYCYLNSVYFTITLSQTRLLNANSIPVFIPERFKKLSYFLSWFFVIIGVAVIAGWLTGYEYLKSIGPNFITVKPNTAIGLLLSGIIMLLQLQNDKKNISKILVSIFAIIIFILGLLTIIQYLLGLNFGIDELLFKDGPNSVDTLYPGRQTPMNALLFALFGLSFFPYLRTFKKPALSQIINLVIAIIAFMTFVTYLFSTDNSYKNYSYLIISFQSTWSFILLALAALFLRPEEGIMKIISSNTVGGRLFRQIFPFCLLVFLLLGWLIFKGERAGFYIAEFGTAIFILSSVIIFTVLLFRTAVNLNSRENVQQQTDQALMASEVKYRTIIEKASDAILVVNEELFYTEVNNKAITMFGYSREDFLQLNVVDITVIEKDESPIKFSDLENIDSIIQERNFRCKDGSILPVEISGCKIENGNYLAIVRDISERRRLEIIIAGEKKVFEMIATDAELDDILNAIVLNYEAVSHSAICSILLPDVTGKYLNLGAGPSLPKQFKTALEKFPIGPACCSCGTAAYLKKAVIVSDIENDPLWIKHSRFTLQFNLRACWSTPILDNNGKVLATFAIYYNDIKAPAAEDLSLIERSSNLVKIALEQRASEVTIKENEEKFSKVFHNNNHAYAILDTGRRYIDVNQSFENMIEFTRDELMGKTSAEAGMNSLEFLQQSGDLVIKLLTEGKLENIETDLETRSGIAKTILISVHEITLKKVQHWLIALVGITEMKKAEKELKETEEKYRTLIEQASDAIFITDPLGKFLIVNNSTLKLTQMLEAEILQMSYYDFLVEEDVQKHPLHLKELAEGKTVVTERLMKSKQGLPVDVEITAKLLTNGNLLAFVKDITVRKKQQQLIIDSEQRLIRAENMGKLGHGFYDIVNNTMTLSAGLYKLFGVKQEDFSHTIEGLKSVIHSHDFDSMNKAIDTLFNTGEVEVEFRIVQPSGDVRNVLFKTVLTRNDTGDFINSFTTALDITEKQKVQQEIENYNSQLSQLTGHLQTVREEERRRIGREIHDDLGQQLTAIKMDAAWIDKNTPEEAAQIKGKLKNILNLLDGSNKSVRRILSELKPSILDEYGLLDAIDLLAVQFTSNTGIAVEIDCEQKKIDLKSEIATCIFRVFQESLTNITKYAQADKVLVSLMFNSAKIMFSVKDNGIGFEQTTLRNNNAFGILGMQERVRALEGHFKIQSIVGKGTEITITLPVTKGLSMENA